MSIESKLNYLFGTKTAIRQAIQQKGVSVPSDTTFRQYADKILLIDGGSTIPPDIELNLQEKTANPTGSQFEVTPDSSYDGLSKVIVSGDVNLKPENVAYGVTIYGVTGTMLQSPMVSSLIPTAYQGYFEQARILYPGDYEHLMILESDQAVAFGFMLSGFNVDSYDEDTTEFTAKRWVYVAYNKQTGQWKLEDWTDSTSNGNSYTKNIRYSDVYIYFGNMVIYPYVISPEPGYEVTDMEFEVFIPSSLAGIELWFSYAGSGTIHYGDGSDDVILPPIVYGSEGSSAFYNKHTYDASGTYVVHIAGPISSINSTAGSNRYILHNVSRILSPLSSTLLRINQLFYNAPLTSIPGNFFEYAKNITDINSVFYGTKIESIPAELFFNLSKLSIITSVFGDTRALGSLPLGLFINNPNISDVKGAFGSSRISAIPNGIFINCPNVKNAENVFASTSILTIPELLFAEGTTGVSLKRMFYNCTALTSIPENILDEVNNPTSIEAMFSGCTNVTGRLPEFWERDDLVSADHGSCFYKCSKADNYVSVPTGWK